MKTSNKLLLGLFIAIIVAITVNTILIKNVIIKEINNSASQPTISTFGTEILTAAMNEYHGTLIVVSHDRYFLEQINVEREIDLNLFS